MPAGPGYIDTNGIYRYGEADQAATFSDLLELGQDATSDAVGTLDGRVDTLFDIASDDPDPYSATLKGLSSDPNLGSTGSITSYFKYLGRTMKGYITVVFNGTGVAAGSGLYYLPLPAVPWGGEQPLGYGYLYDASANTRYLVNIGWNGSNAFITAHGQTAEWGSAGAPFVVAAGDFLRVRLDYETNV